VNEVRIRNVLTEYEAHFHSVLPDSDVHGKSEWKHYGDGTYRFKLSVRNIPLPDQSKVDLWLDGRWLMRLVVENKRVKIDMENDSGSGIPPIKAGQILQIKAGQDILAVGQYKAE
jgi:hypothetical protein